jgi:putative hydrolase of the HAD superfamily
VIRAIILDLGNTIIPFDFTRGYRELQAACGQSPEEIRRRIGSTDLVVRFESGQVAPEDFVAQLSELLGLKVTYSEFRRMWSSIFLPDPLIPESFLESLKKRYRLVLLSNTNAIHFEMLRETYPLLRHFDHFVLSHEVGTLKPEPAVYEHAISHSQCMPGECFFTDDIEAYVEGARRSGIDAEPFRGFDKLQADLRSRGVEW